jgi:hypothetical protein
MRSAHAFEAAIFIQNGALAALVARFRSQESETALTVITSTQAATLGEIAILIEIGRAHV